jgi:uncharacterized membrane protein
MDVLKNYGVDNTAYKLKREVFDQLPIPFLVHIESAKLSHDLFAPVYAVHPDSLELYNPETQKNEIWNIERVDKKYKGTVMILQADEHVGETEYDKNRQHERRSSILNNIILFCLPLLTLITCTGAIINHATTSIIAPIAFTLLTLGGCIITLLLLWQEIDQHNPALKQICQSGKTINCAAILNSKAAKIAGLSWSSIGFTYFMGTLLLLLTNGISNPAILQLLSWINVLALPYTIFSIYYQWKVAKQWCLLCLVVQGLLLLQFTVSLTGGLHSLMPIEQITTQYYITAFSCFAIIFIVVQLLIPAFEKAKKVKSNTIELQRLKHNPDIFQSLLTKQKAIDKTTDGLGIKLGNPHGKYKLVKVCNPYCAPCAKAHPLIEELLKNNQDIQVQIIFSVSEDNDDIKTPVVKHLLAIADKNDESITKKALDDWYMAENKDYPVFANRYSNVPVYEKQQKAIKKMSDWCNDMKITATPTFFVNGYQLPSIYSARDLKYFLTV